MRKPILFSILLITFSYCFSIPTIAQNKVKACLSNKGEITFKVECDKFEVSISQKGEIINYAILSKGTISYDTHERIERVGQVVISYDFYDRISGIGGQTISYDFYNRISRIGSISIGYNYKNKIDRIGGHSISYDYKERIDAIGSAGISYNMNGKIESVNDSNGIFYFVLDK